MTVKEYFEKTGENSTAEILNYDDGTMALWIEKHDRGLTVVDCNSSVRNLNHQDHSNDSVEEIVERWKNCVGWEEEV